MIKKVLITQPKPEGEKSPYFDLAKKHNVELHFHPFIIVDGIPAKEFRKQKIEIPAYSAVIFTSRNAIDHFFRTLYRYRDHLSEGAADNRAEPHRPRTLQHCNRDVSHGVRGCCRACVRRCIRGQEA